MNADKFPAVFVEAFAMHELLRRLGFLPDQIFVSTQPELEDQSGDDYPLHMLCILRAQDKEFAFDLGQTGLTREEFGTLWVEFVNEVIVKATHDELKEMWEGSGVFKVKLDVVQALHAKGFRFPLD